MKKIILGIVFIFASFTMVNASSDLVVNTESARDCVDKALAATEAIGDCFGDDIRGEDEEFYLSVYMDLYEGCMMQ